MPSRRDAVVTATEPPNVEWLRVRECLRFSLRNRRYFAIFAALYWFSLGRWGATRAARYGYCFLQVFDDVMDGDRRSLRPLQDVAEETIRGWANAAFRGDTLLGKLGGAFYASLMYLDLAPGDDPRRDVLELLRAMRMDAERRSDGALLDRAALSNHLASTFYHSLNLLLISAGARTRASHVADLVHAMAWCSVVRDLDADLAARLVNIPRDVADRAAALSRQDPSIVAWLADEKHQARRSLAESAATLDALRHSDPVGARFLGIFQRSVERYAR